MKNYVMAIVSVFENYLVLFKITAENECEAIKKGMLEFAFDEEDKQKELQRQKSKNYCKYLKGLNNVCNDISFSIVEVGSFIEPTKDSNNK